MTVPTTNAGEGLVAYASAVGSNGVADISAEQSLPTSSRDSFTILPKSSSPVVTVASRWVAMDGKLQVSGHGFGHGEALTFALNGLAVGTATATSSGLLAARQLTVPGTDTFGPQTLVVSAKTSGKPVTSTSVYVTNAWSQFGEDPTHSNTEPDDAAILRHLSLYAPDYMAPAWSFNVGSTISGSTDVVDGVAYVADSRGVVYAINVRTGLEKWSRNVSGTSKIDTTPAVVHGLVIVGSVNQRLYALNASTGKEVWTTLTRGAIESSPAAAGANLYVGDDSGDVYALTGSTGKVLWRAKAGGAVKGSPAVDTGAGIVVVGDASGAIRAFAIGNGAAGWVYDTASPVTASPIVLAGTVYVGSHNGNEYALNEGTGHLRWKYATGHPIIASASLKASFAATKFPTLVVPSGNSLLLLSGASGVLQSEIAQPDTIEGTASTLDFTVSELANGDVEGARTLTGAPHAWSTSVPTALSSSPTIVNGEVFVTGKDGTVQCWTVPGSPAA